MIFKAFDNDIVGGNTLKTFKRVKKMLIRKSNARKKILYENHFEELVNHSSRHVRRILNTALYTGMRLGEILNLTWNKVDLKSQLIRLEPEDTKDKEPRNIPICDELYKVLTKDLGHIRKAEDDNHVFLYNNKPIESINRALKTACEKAEITWGRFKRDGFIFHDLRHTFNTNMRKAGVPESVIMQVTGHSTREMFDRYNTIDSEDTRHAINQLQGYLQSVSQNVSQATKNKRNKKDGAM